MIRFSILDEVLRSIASDLSQGTDVTIRIALADTSKRVIADSIPLGSGYSSGFHRRSAVLGSIYYEYTESGNMVGDTLRTMQFTTSNDFELVGSIPTNRGESFFLIVSASRERATLSEVVGISNSVYSRAINDLTPLLNAA